MTTHERTRLVCDRKGPYCQRYADFDGKVRGARTAARLLGWFFSAHPRLDVCPACNLGTTVKL